MAPMSKSLFRSATLAFTLITLCVIANLFRENNKILDVHDGGVQLKPTLEAPEDKDAIALTVRPEETFTRLGLTEDECRTTFPGLTKDVDDAVGRGSFALEKSNPEYQGLVQGRIKDGKLYILTVAPDTIAQIIHQRTAILHQIHRAILTSPTPLPDTHFAFVINDIPKNNSWAFARVNKQSTFNTWLMPSFAFWSWPKIELGAMDDALDRITGIEKRVQWQDKQDQVVWRGTPWFNPVGHPNLRYHLLSAAKGKDWADVERFDVGANGISKNALKIEDFCKYKYIVYTEGVTYSGRLPFHQACKSVMITAPLTYLTTTALLTRPIMAEDLVKAGDTNEDIFHGEEPTAGSSSLRPVLNTVPTYHTANAIYVAPDFSNLEEVVNYLRLHPEIAERIATNQREQVVGGGYLSAAAETCYWRALIRAWSAMAVAEGEWASDLGERFETWILSEVVESQNGARDGMRGAR